MVTILFEAHGTTLDNEARLASGHYDVELSELGIQQAREMGERHENDQIDVIFCSDLQRSYKSAEIAFEGRDIPIIQDARLRECDYGDWTRKPSSEVEAERGDRVATPFPNGESYEDTCTRMKEFLDELKADYDGKTVLIVGHRATQYGLEHWIKGVPILKAVTDPWKWQPGWEYQY